MATVPYVAPERARRPRHLGMRAPYDFFYALLNVWDRRQLGHVMNILGWAIELLPVDLCDISYWAQFQHGVMPVLTPSLAFLPPDKAFARLAEAALSDRAGGEEALKASMRLSALVAFIGDYRVRLAIMANDAGVHGPLGTRAPDPYHVWRFLANDALGAARAYFHAMATADQRRRRAKEEREKPPVLGLGCIRGSTSIEDEEEEGEGGEREALRLTQQWLAELKHLLFVPL